jgi:hypothetical protein
MNAALSLGPHNELVSGISADVEDIPPGFVAMNPRRRRTAWAAFSGPAAGDLTINQLNVGNAIDDFFNNGGRLPPYTPALGRGPRENHPAGERPPPRGFFLWGWSIRHRPRRSYIPRHVLVEFAYPIRAGRLEPCLPR